MVLKLKIFIFVNVGIKPAPRCWLKWNMDKLEPPNIKMREEILNAKTKKCMYTATFFFINKNVPSQNGHLYSLREYTITICGSVLAYSILSGTLLIYIVYMSSTLMQERLCLDIFI